MTEAQIEVHDEKKPHPTEIKVNKKPVMMPDDEATGLGIIEVAISQGVAIELDFILSRVLASGETKVVGLHKVVELHKDELFVAIAGDDNS